MLAPSHAPFSFGFCSFDVPSSSTFSFGIESPISPKSPIERPNKITRRNETLKQKKMSKKGITPKMLASKQAPDKRETEACKAARQKLEADEAARMIAQERALEERFDQSKAANGVVGAKSIAVTVCFCNGDSSEHSVQMGTTVGKLKLLISKQLGEKLGLQLCILDDTRGEDAEELDLAQTIEELMAFTGSSDALLLGAMRSPSSWSELAEAARAETIETLEALHEARQDGRR
jgi:hypothetical protein